MKTIFTALSAFLVLSTTASAYTQVTRGYIRNKNGQIEYYGFESKDLKPNNPYPPRPAFFSVSNALKNKTLSSAQYNLMQQCTQKASTHVIELTLVAKQKPSSGGCWPTDPWCGSTPPVSCLAGDPWCSLILVKSVTCESAPGFLQRFKKLIQNSKI